MVINRPKCEKEDCVNLAKTAGKTGELKFKRFCNTHHQGSFSYQDRVKQKILNDKCSVCSWVGPCDRHNRLFHIGLLNII